MIVGNALSYPPKTREVSCGGASGLQKVEHHDVFLPLFRMRVLGCRPVFSWAFNLPVGGTIVLTMIAGFMMIAATMGVRSAVTA